MMTERLVQAAQTTEFFATVGNILFPGAEQTRFKARQLLSRVRVFASPQRNAPLEPLCQAHPEAMQFFFGARQFGLRRMSHQQVRRPRQPQSLRVLSRAQAGRQPFAG